MSEPRFEDVLQELRTAAPAAPDHLRERVRALPEPAVRRVLRFRPALVAAVLVAIAVGVGAAAIGGLTGSDGKPQSLGARELRAPQTNRGSFDRAIAPNPTTKGAFSYGPEVGSGRNLLSPLVPSGSRLQNYAVAMTLRVRDLSGATKSAVGTTRKLDGFVANADYSTGGNTGVSSLELRVPVDRVQEAIASFTKLGTILSQRIAVADLQAGVDRIDQRLAAARKVVTELGSRSVLTPTERARLNAARATIARLSQSRTRIVREGTYAKISLTLTTRKTAAKHAAPGRFDRFWGDAGDILGKEAIIVLYALVVAGPFALLAALAFLGERARRRRADGRLLEETG